MSDFRQPQMAPQGAMPPLQPGMMTNPAFVQWQQQEAAWQAEKQKREQQFQQACELIKGDAQKRYKIDIEADSTVAADEQAEKQARTEFMQAITPLLGVAIPQMEQNPTLAPLVKELVMFTVRGFRVSRQLEDAFESAFDAIGKGPVQQPPSKGNTKSPMEIQAESQIEQTKAHVQLAGVQQDAQEAGIKAQTANQANMLKMTQIQLQAKIAADKLAQDQVQHEQSLSLQQRETEGREQLEQARLSRLASRNADGLV